MRTAGGSDAGRIPTMATKNDEVGILLMSFGSPGTPDEVPGYLASARGGTSAPDDVVAEFQRRYRVIGGSPHLRRTMEQASALEALLNSEAGGGQVFQVAVGMRHAAPSIRDALQRLATRGIKHVVAIILSPQYSPIIMSGYHRAVDEAKAALGGQVTVRVAGAWHTLPSFLDALVQRVREALERLPRPEQETAPVILSAHSLPRTVVDREPGYIDQLKETATTVAGRVGLADGRWQFAYQSAGHTPQEWLRPDLKELFPGLAEAGHKSVLVVPIQFLSDHLEVLYDIDVAARAEAEQAGLEMRRIETFNAMPEFIRCLVDVVHRELKGYN